MTLTSNGERVGSAVADTNGMFTAPVQFEKLEAGPHVVTASCGVVLTASVDRILTSSSGGQSSTMIILVFFVLAGIGVLKFR